MLKTPAVEILSQWVIRTWESVVSESEGTLHTADAKDAKDSRFEETAQHAVDYC